MDIQYVGEHLLPGRIGQLFVMLSFACTLLATYSFFRSEQLKDTNWRNLGRLLYRVHSVSVIGIAGSLFYIIFNHYFEYNYAYQHSSTDLPLRYMLSCFWEGQEGSFLLWIFWHAVLGNILIYSAGKWESSVMAVVSSVQIILSSMLLGVYVFGLKIGSDPFMLLRENPEMMNIPLFQNPEYVKLIEGTGLNPLLQNYWMTIHPPTLFLGFASTLIPFAYAIAGLWKRAYTEWLKPVLPWTFFGVLILGTGVLMGGAWAYEALSFGGFWAWDPVENASLVPWLFLVSAAHLMLINKQKGTNANSLFSTFAITLLTFLLVLYSTYLTRSGILGESSVHSFAEGMPGQLIFFLVLYVLFSTYLLIRHWKSIPNASAEEHFLSREFWMFIASLVFVIAAFQITFTTSIPVINAIFNTNMAPPINVIDHYNSWQIPFAIVVAVIMAIGQFMKYKKTKGKELIVKILPGFLISIALTIGIAIYLRIDHSILIGLLFASLLAVTLNLDYLIRVLNGKVKNGGAAIAHVGFGLILLGSLLSAGLQQVISRNTSGIDIRMEDEEGDANMENILLYKNDTLPMGPYLVTYNGQVRDGVYLRYNVSYVPRDPKSGRTGFSLFPSILLNEKMGNVAEPDTRHALDFDLFTHVTYVNKQDFEENYEPKFEFADSLFLSKGDSAVIKPYLATVKGVSREVDASKYQLSEGDLAVKAIIEINNLHGHVNTLEPILIIRENQLYYISDADAELGIQLSLVNIDPENGRLTIVAEKDANKKEDFIIMKAVIFPYINVLWIGCIVMIVGIGISIWTRVRKNKTAI